MIYLVTAIVASQLVLAFLALRLFVWVLQLFLRRFLEILE